MWTSRSVQLASKYALIFDVAILMCCICTCICIQVRFIPALNISADEIQQGLDIFEEAMQETFA
jgi:4-aminobutyrate aminotransferase-like enzyme